MKQSGLEIRKQRFHEKREFVETRKNGVKSLAKTGYVSAQKSHANYFTYTAGSNRDPVCVSTEVVKYRIG